MFSFSLCSFSFNFILYGQDLQFEVLLVFFLSELCDKVETGEKKVNKNIIFMYKNRWEPKIIIIFYCNLPDVVSVAMSEAGKLLRVISWAKIIQSIHL